MLPFFVGFARKFLIGKVWGDPIFFRGMASQTHTFYWKETVSVGELNFCLLDLEFLGKATTLLSCKKSFDEGLKASPCLLRFIWRYENFGVSCSQQVNLDSKFQF